MPREAASLLAFNRGIISRLGLARIDIKRSAMSAEIQTNFVPRVLGSMSLRPGTGYIGGIRNNLKSKEVKFIFATNDTAILEMTDSTMRVRVNDTLISRVSVATVVNNGDFTTDLTGWTDADQAGTTSTWVAPGYMSLVGSVYNSAIRYQTLSVAPADIGKLHALRVVVHQGYPQLSIGTTVGGTELFNTATLNPGTHSLTFTPTTATPTIWFAATTQYSTLIDSVQIEAPGVLELPTIWDVNDLPYIRYTQSGDVVFVACTGNRQQRIERRDNNAWSVVDYLADDGPFRDLASNGILMTPGALTGDTTLTSTQPFFKTGHVGALFQLTSIGQTVATSFTGDNQFSNPIKITGVGPSRTFTVVRSGTFSATLTLQRSVTDTSNWVDVITYTTAGTATVLDGLDNQIIFYRIGIKTGQYVSGQADTILSFASGGLTGIGRVTAFTDSTHVSVITLKPFGASTATENWREGDWSDYRGWPSAVAIYEGRMSWAGKDSIWQSVSDAYNSFDDTVTGDSGPINRTIGEGPVDLINWLMPVQRLIVGTQGAEKAVRSSSFDEPLTPSNWNIKDASTQGSTSVPAVKIDTEGIFVQRSGTAVYRLTFDATTYDYGSVQLTDFAPEVCNPGVVAIDIQRQTDTRIHCVLGDGTVAILVFDRLEQVTCWVKFETDGLVEDVIVMPGQAGTEEDAVYYTVARTVGGQTVRNLERWALESECVGDQISKNIDAFVVYQGAAVTVIPGLGHLEGEQVVAWGDGKDLGLNQADPSQPTGTFLVAGGQITIPVACANVVAGLGYDAKFKSAKLAYAAGQGTPLNRKKRLISLGLILDRTHAQGLMYGDDFDHLQSMPRTEGEIVPPDTIWDQYDKEMEPLNSEWLTDSRLCLTAASPRPVTVLCSTIVVETNG